MSRTVDTLKQTLSIWFEPSLRYVEFYQQRRFLIGITGLVTFPLYWIIWTYVYPQQYESASLRIAGMLFLVLLLVSDHWPYRIKKFLPFAWYGTLLYCLPFFFTFMMLKNNASPIWVESLLVAIFAMVLLLDFRMLLILSVVGSSAALLAHALTSDVAIPFGEYGPHLWVGFFAIVFGAAVNLANERIRTEQAKAMLATAGSVAHELRTPLMSIKAGAGGIKNYLPLLLSTYKKAQASGLDVPSIRQIHLSSLDGALQRIDRDVDHSNAIIDMLITNVRGISSDRVRHDELHIKYCISEALSKYPFTQQESGLVTVKGDDFCFLGDLLLTQHVLFNLIKNALRHIAKAGKGEILITTHAAAAGQPNLLLFRDTGPGIPASVLPRVFDRFYSGNIGDSAMGSGIGLAFCRDVIEAYGGSISCRSMEGRWTEFKVEIPESYA